MGRVTDTSPSTCQEEGNRISTKRTSRTLQRISDNSISESNYNKKLFSDTESQHFYPSGIVNYLVLRKGIQMIASEIAQKGLPIAGRLQYFNRNWEVISQDQWILDSIQNFRIPFRERPIQGKASNPLSLHSDRTNVVEGRDPEFVGKESYRENSMGTTAVCLQHVPSGKEGWRSETSNQSETTELLCEYRTFQDGRDSLPTQPAKVR